VYNVQMKRYGVSAARERLADILDAAEAGERVIIERRGVEYTIAARKPGARARTARRSLIASADPAIMNGQWTWSWKGGGLALSKRRGR
jgi:antitoxin (DNA-binding transcriptional repressor) of toxin-antitoxin stability system